MISLIEMSGKIKTFLNSLCFKPATLQYAGQRWNGMDCQVKIFNAQKRKKIKSVHKENKFTLLYTLHVFIMILLTLVTDITWF